MREGKLSRLRELPIQSSEASEYSDHSQNKDWLVRVYRKETPPTLLTGMQFGTATMENSIEISSKEKLTIELPCGPTVYSWAYI